MKKRMAKAQHRESKQKAIAYQLIPPDSESGKPLYERLYTLIDTHHEDVSHANVRVALVWAKSWKPDVDGRLTLGKCKKATDLDRELVAFDFVIMLNRDWWLHPKTTEKQQQAVLDHECCHMAITVDKDTGEPVVDDRGRNVFRIRAHSIEEFTEIVDRHGVYKNDVEAFARAVYRAEQASRGTFIGYTSLSQLLARIGLTVDPRRIAEWSESERREVYTFALVNDVEPGERQVSVALSSSMPACLAAAVRPQAAGESSTH